MKMQWILIIVVAVVVAAGGMFTGCSGGKKTQWQNAEPGTILVDYYTSIFGTDGYDTHYELVLKKTEAADTVLLEEYEGDAKGERCTQYTVPIEAVEKCYEIIDGNRLHTWNKKYKENPSTGGSTVCRFYDGEKQVRVTTDCMPQDGAKILHEIGQVMQSYQQ